MKIKKIKKLSNSKYKIELDKGQKIILYDDVILKNNLLFNQELTSEILNKINKDNKYYDLYNKCVSQISRRLRSENEINQYLTKNMASEKEKHEIIENLKKLNLINDKTFAKAFISDKVRLSNLGPHRIKEELIDHEIDDKVIEEEISNINNDEIKTKLKKIVLKKVSNNHKHSRYMMKQKVISNMLKDGYDYEMILDILNGIDINNNVLEKEFDKLYNQLLKKDQADIYKVIKNKLFKKGFSNEEIIDMINQKTNN